VIFWDDVTITTGLIGLAIIILALIVLARSVMKDRNLPVKHRYRFGVFMEHDYDTDTEEPEDDSLGH
jgi:hypothetical protein